MVETILLYGIVALTAMYSGSLVVLFSGLRNTVSRAPRIESDPLVQELPNVSIIVSARNEEHNLQQLISCLTQQDYPREKFEAILVDDRSVDNTWEILRTASQEHSFVLALRVADTMPGFAPKKRAIDLAIQNAGGEIILLTDADCTPPSTWARTMVSYYREGVAGVIGYSPYRFDNTLPQLLRGILTLEYFSIFAVAAGSSGTGRALTASGTNFSYRKQTYMDIGGFESVKGMISGDDDLLVNEVTRRGAGRFSFVLDSRAHVPAAAPVSWRQFWNQRIRYASKGRHYGGAMTVGLVVVYLMNLFIVAGPIASLFGSPMFLWMSAGAWGVKSALEFGFLRYAAGLFQERRLLRFFLPTAILHPVYVTVFGFLGLFAAFRWKE